MKIEIERLTEEGEDFERVYAPGDLLLKDEHASLAANARVWGHASRKRDEVRLAGNIDTTVELLCDRCAAPTTRPVNVEFKAELGLAAPSEGDADGIELHDADMDFSTYEGDAVVLDEIVREQILLALPTRQLCTEECKGLCPTCGANLNEQSCDCERETIDPRWSALAELKNRES
ncbi:MAG: YceD family protein [Pyrinomonadaceae bacterium]